MYPISSTSSTDPTVQNWTFTVTFINLTTNQTENGGKTLNAEIVLSREVYTNPDTVLTAYSNGALTTHTLGNYDISLDCSMGSAVWDNKAGGVVIDFSSANRAKCNVNYTEKDSVTYLNTYITGLSGSAQGDGEVVDEPNATIPDYTNGTAIAQSGYSGTAMYSSSSYSSTSGTTNTNSYTFSGNSWTSVPSNMTSNTYYHIKFKPSSSGYYQVCYTMSSGYSSNRLYIYKETSQQSINGSSYLSASTSSSQNGCVDIGYVDTSTDVRIVQRAYSNTSYPIATITFNLQKATSTSSIDTGYRYEGKNPNNYIWFNNELWRIIGVFGSESHGQSGKNLVKIIRTNSIGGFTRSNDWTTSGLMKLLNGAYLNAQDGTDTGYCYGSYGVPSNCNYTNIGINDTYRNMIANVRWYLGGYSTENAEAEVFYGYERGTVTYFKSYWDGKIGLLLPSDYGYSVLASSCARTTDLYDYDTSSCAGQSWFYGQGYEWTITPNSSDYGYAFVVDDYGGRSYSGSTDRGYGVRPVLYLDSSVYLIDGNGTVSNPYIIGK